MLVLKKLTLPFLVLMYRVRAREIETQRETETGTLKFSNVLKFFA